MAIVAMIESWLQSTGLSLPPLIRELGHEYVLFTRDPALYPPLPDGSPHPVIACATETVVVETNDASQVGCAAEAVARRLAVGGVLTTCDYYLETVAIVARRLGLPGAAPEAMRRATRKDQVRESLAAAGVPDAAYASATTWSQARAAGRAIGYPLVAKPVDLNSGTGVRLVADEAALKDAFWEATGAGRNTRDQPLRRVLLVEEVLPGPEVSVEAVTVDAATTILGITDKSTTGPPAFVEAGHRFPARLGRADATAVEELVGSALRAVGLTHGLSHTEVKLTPSGPRIVELNPRQGGGYIFDLVRLVTGTDPLRLLVQLALGERPRLGTVGAPLPGAATWADAAVAFVLSPVDGDLATISGASDLDPDRIARVRLERPASVHPPSDNNARLGHVLAVDQAGGDAGRLAAEAVETLRIELTSGRRVPPVAVRWPSDQPVQPAGGAVEPRTTSTGAGSRTTT